MEPVRVRQGQSPVILAFPHTGTHVPDAIAQRLNDNGHCLADTDWHIDRVYDGLLPEATTVQATFHRYVIDANRDPTGNSLYPGQNTTGLVPETDFDGVAIWRDGEAPSAEDISQRLAMFHAPYHAALTAEIARVKALHGIALLYDCHSIRAHIPFLFEGRLPDFNVGTDNGRTCAPELEASVAQVCAAASGYTSVRNGRFKGGWTTRHYGKPERNVHAIQMELAQSTYLESEAPPWAYSGTKVTPLRTVLKDVLATLHHLALEMRPHG